MVDQGIIGLASFVAMLGIAFLHCWRIVNRFDQIWRAQSIAVFSALTAIVVSGLYELSFLRIWVVVILLAQLGVVSQITRCAGGSGANTARHHQGAEELSTSGPRTWSKGNH